MSSSVLAAILSDASQTDSQTDSIQTPEPDDLRRARALLIACVTMALERFGFYTLVALFVLFLVDRGQSEAQATTWYGVMMGATYFTPLFGGALADRFGRWLCICIGAFLLALSYGLLTAGFLPLSIILLSIGMGLFKSNITAAVGSLYQSDKQRDLSLSRLYWAVNLGALPAGVVGGWLAKHYGYSAAFLSAAVACLLAWCLWMFSGRALFSEHLVTAHVRPSQASEKDRLATIYVLLPVACLFFLSFHQNGSSMTLFANDNTILSLFGVPIQAPWFQSVNAGLVIGLTPLISRFWQRLSVASNHKFIVGMLLSAASSLIMSMASVVARHQGRVSPWWLLASYFVMSCAELCVAPIGFSIVTKLAPKRLLGVLMGAWFAAIAIGNLGAGLIGRYWSVWSHQVFFFVLATTSGCAALLLMMHRGRLGKVLRE